MLYHEPKISSACNGKRELSMGINAFCNYRRETFLFAA